MRKRLFGTAIAAGAVWVLLAPVHPHASDLTGRVTGELTTHLVAPGETLKTIAARVGVDASTLALDNRLSRATRLTAGQLLQVDNRHIVPSGPEPGTMVINIPQRMLFYLEGSGASITGLPVAVGQRTWQTPSGAFTIVAREEDPTWDVPTSILEEARRAGRSLPKAVPPGPNNPLGRFWLGLSIGGVGIHGTNTRSSIYGAVTHGCIRLHPDDIAWLFPRVPVGTRGRIVYEPVLLAADDGDVFLEAHPDVYRRAARTLKAIRLLASTAGLNDHIDWTRAEEVLAARHGVARSVMWRDR